MLTEESPSHSQAKPGPTIASNRSVNSTTNDSRTKFDKQPMGFTELSGSVCALRIGEDSIGERQTRAGVRMRQ